MRNDLERLRDILEAIDRIERYSVRGEAAFRSDELIQNWMISNIQVIGEAARSLSQDFRDRTRTIPWSHIVGMRHVLVHKYFGIDVDIVWQVVSNDLPVLKRQIEAILTENNDS